MSIDSRLKRLEKQIKATQRQIIVIWQDKNDPDLYHGGGVNEGKHYRRGSDIWPDENKFTILRVVYDR